MEMSGVRGGARSRPHAAGNLRRGGLAILADGSTERITPTEFVSDWHYQQEQ